MREDEEGKGKRGRRDQQCEDDKTTEKKKGIMPVEMGGNKKENYILYLLKLFLCITKIQRNNNDVIIIMLPPPISHAQEGWILLGQ